MEAILIAAAVIGILVIGERLERRVAKRRISEMSDSELAEAFSTARGAEVCVMRDEMARREEAAAMIERAL